MTASVIIRYHEEPEGWWADSEEVPGWTCAGSNLEEVRALAAEGIHEFVGSDVLISEALPQIVASSSASTSGTLQMELLQGLFSLTFSVNGMPSFPNRPWTKAPQIGTAFEEAFQAAS
jgi:predicted RNase H-like HicB family nuclease